MKRKLFFSVSLLLIISSISGCKGSPTRPISIPTSSITNNDNSSNKDSSLTSTDSTSYEDKVSSISSESISSDSSNEPISSEYNSTDSTSVEEKTTSNDSSIINSISSTSSLDSTSESSSLISSEIVSSDVATSSESSSISSSSVILDNIYGGYYSSLKSWENGADLKKKLSDLIQIGEYQPYNSNWEVNALADQSQTNFDMVEQVYSTEEILKKDTYSSSNTKGWQKEHAFCQSLMNHYVSSGQKICEIQDGYEVNSISIRNGDFILTHSDGTEIIVRRLAYFYQNESNQNAINVYYIKNDKLIKDFMIGTSYVGDGDEIEICSVSDINKFISQKTSAINFVDMKVELKDGTIKDLETINRLYVYKNGEGADGGVASDYHNLFASFSSGNSSRSNKQFGIVEDGTSSYDYKATDLLFEPNDSDKGKLARAILYMDTCYEDVSLLDGSYSEDHTLFYNHGMHGNKEIIISWAKTYGVDYHEYQHNIRVEEYQNNRNPYIDFPGLVDYVYGDKQTQAGTLLDVYESSAYKTLKMDNPTLKNIAIENVKYEYTVGEKFSLYDIGNIYEIYTDLSKKNINSNNQIACNINENYEFSTSDLGAKEVVVSYGQHQVKYQIKVSGVDDSKASEYQYSFIVDDKANSSLFGTGSNVLSSTNPMTLNLLGIEFNFSLTAGKRGTGNANKGVGFGSGTSPIDGMVIESTSDVSYESFTKVKAIYINASNSSGGSFTIQVYVGDTLVGSQNANNTDPNTFSFILPQGQEGKVKIVFTNVTKTLYLRDILIDFE